MNSSCILDVSTSFKKLQAERRGIDGVISELTPLEGSKDVAALREYLTNVNMKVEVSGISNHDRSSLMFPSSSTKMNYSDSMGSSCVRSSRFIFRRSSKHDTTGQEERLEELRDTHRLENTSQVDQMEKLRQQLSETEALLAASQTEEDDVKRDSEIEHLRSEVSKANTVAKEEEEKRVKAISLLKTVRQKLVKAEKERDDALRELNEMKDKNLEEKEKDRAERANLEREINTINAEREKAVTGLRVQFDKDFTAAKERAERDIQVVKKQFDAETNALKVMYLYNTFFLTAYGLPDFALCGNFRQKVAYQHA